MENMRRRAVLGAVSAGIASVAGCAASSDFGPSTETTPSPNTGTPYTPPDYPSGRGDLTEFDPEYTSEEIRVGSRERVEDPENNEPHQIRVWNATSAARTVELRITDDVEQSVVLNETYDIPANASLSVSLLEPSYYVLEIRPSETSQETLGVPRSLFDCNRSATRIGIFEDGTIKSIVISEALACPTDGGESGQ